MPGHKTISKKWGLCLLQKFKTVQVALKHRSLWTQAPPSSCSAVRFCAYWRGRSIRYQTLKLRMYGTLLPFLSYYLKHLVHYYTDFFCLWIWWFHIMLLSILMCRVTLVNHCQEGTSIGTFAYVCFSPKKPCCWYPWGGPWSQDTHKEGSREMGFTMGSKHW